MVFNWSGYKMSNHKTSNSQNVESHNVESQNVEEQNVEFTKCRTHKMSNSHNVECTKCRIHKMSNFSRKIRELFFQKFRKIRRKNSQNFQVQNFKEYMFMLRDDV